MQRLAVEPRVPMVEGMQFVPETNAECHYMLQAILFRPVYLPPAAEDETRSQRLLRGYRELCTPPAGQGPWPAQHLGPGNPGPFQRAWAIFVSEQESAARNAERKTRQATGLCSLWRTIEVRERLARIVARDVTDCPSGSDEPKTPLPSVEEYAAVVTLQTSENYARIAHARTAPKQRREADDAVAVPEVAADLGGDGEDGEADGQVEAAEARAQAGLASLGANTRIAHHFSPEMLEKITSFTTADRTQAFVKDLLKSEIMQTGELPQPDGPGDGAEQRAHRIRNDIQERYAPLADLGPTLRELVDMQRKFWKSTDTPIMRDPDCPDEDSHLSRAGQRPPAATF